MNREQQFREAINENSQRIFRICSFFFHDQEERNDAYQESLIRIWENLGTFRGKSKLSTWIYRVTVNSCLAGIRKDKQHRSYIQTSEELRFVNIPFNSIEEENDVQDEKMSLSNVRVRIYRIKEKIKNEWEEKQHGTR